MRHMRDIELIELAGGQIAPDEMMRSHLAACAECRRRYEAMRQVHTALGAISTDGADVDLWPAVANRLDERAPIRLPGAQATALRLLRVAATVLIGAGLGHGAGRLWLPTNAPPTPTDAQLDSVLALGALELPSATGLVSVFELEEDEAEVQP